MYGLTDRNTPRFGSGILSHGSTKMKCMLLRLIIFSKLRGSKAIFGDKYMVTCTENSKA